MRFVFKRLQEQVGAFDAAAERLLEPGLMAAGEKELESVRKVITVLQNNCTGNLYWR